MEKNHVEDLASGISSDAEHKHSSNKLHMPCCCQIAAEKRDMPCGSHKIGSRNLIVCIDGTANQFGDKNTNVIEMYNLILKEEDHNQRTWYNSGIGTYVRPSAFSPEFYKQWVFHNIDLAIAWDFKKTILGAYRWLSDNYEPGDCIFLFGFSRGAYQVRVLSAMIEKVGLIFKGNEMQIPFAYELYADPNSGEKSEEITNVGQPTEQASKAERFKKAFSRKDVKVHFVGAWDTVSSIGVVRGTNMLPGTIDGMKHVCYFRHALALDERRVKFLPEYAYGGCTKPPISEEKSKGKSTSNQRTLDNPTSTENKDPAESLPIGMGSSRSFPHTKEVWFAGTHSDIGGGNVENTAMNRARPPLRWMVFEAGAVGLRTARFERELLAKEQINIIESLTWPWWLFEICPIKRLTFTGEENGQLETTRVPHYGWGRKILPGQKIHSSLLRAGNGITESDHTMAKDYIPKASTVDGSSFWQRWRHDETGGNTTGWLELDLYEYIKDMVEQLITKGDDTALQSLHHTSISSDARQSVYNAVIEELGRKNLTPEIKHQFLCTAMGILKKISQGRPDFKLTFSRKIRSLLLDLWNNDDKELQKTAQDFMSAFTSPCWVAHLQNFPETRSMWSDGKHVVSGSDDGTVRVLDVETGKPVGKPLRGHTDLVRSVAITSDGRHLVSGSDDTTVRVWDVEAMKPVGEPLQGHTNWVRSVAISSDGRHVVSGSDDKTVRVWDVETMAREPVRKPLQGHTDWVTSVAITSDGKRVVSGSDDKTVRVWDVETLKPVGNPLKGHTLRVTSVVITSDGKHIVSGSDDKTVRVWNVETMKPVGNPLKGHKLRVTSVAISSDGKHVVSGSDDKTVRFWDVETMKQVGEPLQTLGMSVESVAFLAEDECVVSCSLDGSVWIRDLEHSKYDTAWTKRIGAR